MHTTTEAYFLHLQGSSRKAHSLDYPVAECTKLFQNSNKAIQEQPKLVDAYVASFENSILHPAKQCVCWLAQRHLLHFLHITCWYE
jgi:hypothetical protein